MAKRFKCFSCGRGSDTEMEHITHRCNRFAAWRTRKWRQFKVLLGLYSYYPSAKDLNAAINTDAANKL